MKGTPYFSVIVPVYNRAHLIRATLNAILAQDFRDFEVIVVDDGSDDETGSVVSAIIDSRLVYYKISNSERGAARNFGAARAQGKYLNFFDSDDLMHPNHLMVAYQFVTGMQFELEFFHTGYILKDQAENLLIKETGVPVSAVRRRLIVTNFLGCDSVFVRKDIFLQHRFQEDRRLASSEDWELWLRLSSQYELHRTKAVTLSMINHSERSLFTISPDRIIERDTLLMDLLFGNQNFNKTYGAYRHIFEADRYTFFALVLVIAGRKKESAGYLKRALQATSRVLLRRRFWASLKHIVLK